MKQLAAEYAMMKSRRDTASYSCSDLAMAIEVPSFHAEVLNELNMLAVTTTSCSPRLAQALQAIFGAAHVAAPLLLAISIST